MAGLQLAKEDKIIFGVCKGLENSRRGSAFLWRIIFIVSTCTLGFPFLIYIGLALFLPKSK
ncbi:PspC domain-containing protein [Prochlorococcus marinus]|uniref:Phage shock protein PspC N-terminal domain-containing protein n=1 Tax=Prochlorococcus marinus (strain MIT 9211) TaxID=93059 RepID=A9BBC9_PROM4|nr:PspC domain-containing protein [Prochlorococcus marinus]ABX09141.1 Hypothetical protein P9211_12101 [Prochlorococcus marinus str. MIT 9211]